jgi:RNA polymerase sigma-70 factor (ECF subfamily)
MRVYPGSNMAPDETSGEVTQLLAKWSKGDSNARDAVIPLVYTELRRLAASYLRRERSDHTLEATALVHEAYLRLVGREHGDFESRQHFFAAAAQLMRRILVDHARGRLASKRGSGAARVELTEAVAMSREQPEELLALDESLTRLASVDPQQGRIVELRVFTGLTVEETAAVMSISPATVKRDWALAKVWLLREIRKESPA